MFSSFIPHAYKVHSFLLQNQVLENIKKKKKLKHVVMSVKYSSVFGALHLVLSHDVLSDTSLSLTV